MAEEENTRIQTNGILLYWGMYVDKYVDDDEKEHYTRFLIDKVKQHMISIIIQSNEIASEFVWFVLANDMDFGIVCVNFINNMLEPNHRNKIVTEFNKHKAAYLNYKQDFDESISQVSQYTAVEQCSNTACTKLKEELKSFSFFCCCQQI